MKNFIARARKNGIEFSTYLLKQLIVEYTNDPVSVINFENFKREKKYDINYKLLADKDVKSIRDKGLAKKYNTLQASNSSNRIGFVNVIGDEEKAMPIQLDYGFCYVFYDSIIGSLSNRDIRALTIQAYEDRLDQDLFDQDLIELLKSAYNTVKMKAEEMQTYLDSLHRNAEMVYLEIYKKLIRNYKLHPSNYTQKICIKVDSDRANPSADLFNNASLDDKIIYCCYTDDDYNYRFVPVQISVLKQMLDQDYYMGFSELNDKGDLSIKFNTEDFEKALVKLNEEIEEDETSLKLKQTD